MTAESKRKQTAVDERSNGFQKVPLPPDLERPIPLSENARTVLRKRYLRRGPDGKPVETEQEMFWRVAYHVAKAEAEHGGEVEPMARRFYDLLTTLRFFPNSPTFTGAGTPLGQLAACFVLPIDDDMGRTGSGIFETLRHAALIQQTGGGNGFSFSRLRPKGALVRSSSGAATGPVGFLRVYDQAFGEIAQGGCLVPNTLVFTGEGTLYLDEIVTHQEPGWRPHRLTVATDEGQRESRQAYCNGVAPVLRVRTQEGLELTGTHNHKVKVMTTDGPAWRRLDELQPGDAILVKLGQHRGQLQALRQPVRRHGNQVWPTFPSVLDEELAFFLGYLAGDGFVASGDDDHRVGVTVAHSSYLFSRMPMLFKRLFGEQIHVHRQQKADDASVTFWVDNRAVKDFLALNGLDKLASTRVRVPRLIRQSPPEVVGAYLRGLFEADGSIQHGYPLLMSSSEQLIREVAVLLIGLGCPVRISRQPQSADRYGTAPMFALRVHSFVGLKAWRERIGCDPASRFAACLEFAPDLTRETTYPLPNASYWVEPVLEAITLPQIDARGRGTGKKLRASDPWLRKQLLRYVRGERQLTLSGYELLKRQSEEFAAHARLLNDLWFVKVAAVEPAGESLTLDLEVDDNHTYLAGGWVTHNSRRGANMAVLRVDHPDIREFITCKTDENAITNFNISVGITDAFMRAVEEDADFDLVNPQDGSVWETVRARELFDLIVRQAHHNGEPGVLFLDTANRQNPVPHLYELESTNPCVTGDTLVATPSGWRRADEIEVGDEICTTLGTGRVETIEVHEAKPVYAVHFSDGGVVRATAAHQFYVYDLATGEFVPRRLDRLQIGDQVRVYQPVMASPYLESPTDTSARIVKIEPAGIARVYDLYEPVSDTWITEGYVSRGCGEQFLGPFENCCLGSINLAKHLTPDDRLDWDKLAESVELSTRFLDDVVTANAYVPAVPQLKEAAHRVRRIGLGIMGLADVMYVLGIRYGGEDGQEFASQLMEFVRYHAMRTSIALARERGPFPAIKGSIYDPDNLLWQPPQPLVPYTRDWGRPPLDWSQIVEGIRQYGIRNGAQLTIAPTGTISTVAGIEGYGCEPVFALAYMRYVNDNGKQITLQYTSPLFERALRRAGLDDAQIAAIVEQVNLTGTCQDVPGVPEEIKRVFVVSGDVTAEEHVRMQAALQVFVDNAISKCVTGDTLVLTTQGLVPIAELASLRLPDQFAPLDLEIVTPQGIERADSFYYGGMRETRRVTLSYGYQIEGTPNHPVHILDENGTIRFAALGDLKVGDTVVLYSGQQVFGPAGQSLPPYHVEQRTNTKRVRFPERMSADLAYVLGCITSEGSIGRNGVAICNGDRALLEHLGELFERLFGLNSYICPDKRRESVYTLQVNSRPLREWLLNVLGLQAGARNKTIPPCILRASRQEIVAFLRGLFLDAYMIQNGRMFGISLASEKLLQQLQVLLLNFGVFSRRQRTADHAWTLTVAGEALEQLAAFVEFDELWKSERIQLRHEGRQRRTYNYGTLLPRPVTAALRAMQETSTQSLRSLFGKQTAEYQRARVNLLAEHRLDREMARAIWQHFSDTTHPFTEAFFKHDRDGLLYVQVESVEAGFAEVFDISVPGSHSFIANGLGNHNTINFPPEATEDDVRTAYQLGWKLGCKGMTVYVTGSREKVVLETAKTRQMKEKGEQPTSQIRLFNEEKKPRPRFLEGKTYRVETPLGATYVTVNENGEGKGQPFEVFIHTAKAGSDTAAVSEALGRLISYILRLVSPVPPRNRLREVVRQLAGIGGVRAIGFGPYRVSSLPDGISQVLQEYLNESEENAGDESAAMPQPPAEQLPLQLEHKPQGDLCPECGAATLVNEEGCRKCYSCGFSEC